MKSAQNLIVVDSNFILLPFQFKIDYLHEIRELLEGELKFIIFQQVLNELEAKKRREAKSTKFRRLFEAGLLYLEKKKATHVNVICVSTGMIDILSVWMMNYLKIGLLILGLRGKFLLMNWIGIMKQGNYSFIRLFWPAGFDDP